MTDVQQHGHAVMELFQRLRYDPMVERLPPGGAVRRGRILEIAEDVAGNYDGLTAKDLCYQLATMMDRPEHAYR